MILCNRRWSQSSVFNIIADLKVGERTDPRALKDLRFLESPREIPAHGKESGTGLPTCLSQVTWEEALWVPAPLLCLQGFPRMAVRQPLALCYTLQCPLSRGWRLPGLRVDRQWSRKQKRKRRWHQRQILRLEVVHRKKSRRSREKSEECGASEAKRSSGSQEKAGPIVSFVTEDSN